MCPQYFLTIIFALWLSNATAASHAQTYRFDFGSSKVAEGFQAVTSSMTYNSDRGFGFEPGAIPIDVVREKGSILTKDFVTSTGVFCFSVKLPEGNYKVTLTLGDPQGMSCTTVKSEVRRLMMERLQTNKGETLTVSFGVNVRTPQLSKGNAIKLNSRELDYATGIVKTYTWDDKLTLQFYGTAPAVCAIEIEPASEDVVTVFIIGDSTVTDQASGGTWGQYLPRWFDSHIVIANHAESGMTIKGFRFGRRWDKIMESAHPGDYLLIQLGTNDEKKRGHDPMWDAADYAGDWVRTHSDPEKDYVWGLATMALEAKRHGMIPIIVSPMTKIDRKTATATEVMTSYGTNARRGAELGECAYVDLWRMSREIIAALGRDALSVYADGTHTDNYGAYLFSLGIVQAIRDLGLGLSHHILPDTPNFDAKHPKPTLKDFACPIEPSNSVRKPATSAANGQTEFGPL